VNSKITLLGASEIRDLAEKLELRPTKKLGQNFVIDSNTCQRIVKSSQITSADQVVEVGPGLGSLTLAILETTPNLIAIEVDQRLAKLLPETISTHSTGKLNFQVINEDALQVASLPVAPTALVANLPYNISTPVLLSFLERFPTITKGIVMVQAEVADRLIASPNSKEYGAPSIKGAWWAKLTSAGSVARSIFWPIPNVDSKLVRIERIDSPGDEALRKRTFSLIDAAFSQRRKMLRSSLSSILGEESEEIIARVGIDPTARGETLDLSQFVKIARAKI
jgi:16S rRNA (adenine1518-N6/adenine1519-N6)-dimethyltransferase